MKQEVDPFELERFIKAQDRVYERVCAELRNGRKESHWMWFIFPQVRGLGSSETAKAFGIASCEEAEAYLKHPILGTRLRECSGLVNLIEGRSAENIFGYPDNLKFRSSMTLFAKVSSDRVFQDALTKFFAGEPDERTLFLLRGH
jgi:uncharacterized protein (DUF1810 family)